MLVFIKWRRCCWMKVDSAIARVREVGTVKQRKLGEEKSNFDLFCPVLHVHIHYLCVTMAASIS